MKERLDKVICDSSLRLQFLNALVLHLSALKSDQAYLFFYGFGVPSLVNVEAFLFPSFLYARPYVVSLANARSCEMVLW